MNASGAGSGAIQGAQMGAQFGPYGAAIGGAIGFVAGLFSSDPNDALLAAQKKFNEQVVKNTATSLFDRERAQNIERMRTAQALRAYQDQGQVQQSELKASYGAADLIGASATALSQTLDYQTRQAKNQTMFNYAISYDNYLTDIEQITNSGINQLQQTINSAPQKGLNIADAFKAGQSIYAGLSSKSSGGYNAGLQLGSTPQIGGSQVSSNYTLPSNIGLQFKGF